MAALASPARSLGVATSDTGGCDGIRSWARLVQMLVRLVVAISLSSALMAALDGVTSRTFSYDSEQRHAAIEVVEAQPGTAGVDVRASDRHPRYAYDHPANLAGANARIDGYRSAPQTAARVADDVVGAQQGTVLGRYRGGTDAFLGKPGFNVLDLPSKGTGRWYWSRNRAFIDDAIARGDEIRLVTNPFEPLYSGGNVFQRELRYLKDLGYGFEEAGDFWRAVPGR